MNLTYLLIGLIIGIFFQKNVFPIIESLFELLYLKVEHKKSNFAYEINLVNKEINELHDKDDENNIKCQMGFRIKGDRNA